MKIKTTPLTEDDINEALALVHNVFKEFVGKDYSETGKIFFKKAVDNEFIRNLPNRNGFSLITKDNGRITGILSIRDFNHIALFFVHKEYQGKGIGRNLFEEAKRIIIKNGKANEMQVHSSPYAVPIYQALGFIVAEAEKEENGMNYMPMKHLIKRNGI